MGADGRIRIYDADEIDKAGLRSLLFSIYANVYERKIFDRRVYTVYSDSEHHELYSYDHKESIATFKEEHPEVSKPMSKIDKCYIDTWEVWS